MVPDSEIVDLVRALAKALSDRGWKMAAAESCTGGWIAKCCTDLPGSSAWFERGFVSYSNEAKMEMLGVDRASLESHGAVSRVVAEQMALGARRHAPVEVSLSVTGIAGPEGGSAEKPTGTVWFAWSIADREVESRRIRFEGDRNVVRRQTVREAVEGLLIRIGQA